MDHDCDNIQSLEDEIRELEERRELKERVDTSSLKYTLQFLSKVVEDLQEETDRGDLQWNDKRSHSETVLFSTSDINDTLVISKLKTGESLLVVTAAGDPDENFGLFLKGSILDRLLGAIERQLADKKK